MSGESGQLAEFSVLGAVLYAPECISKVVAAGLTGEDFQHGANGVIFACMVALWEREAPIDPVTLSEELRTHNLLEEAGGVNGLFDLLSKATTAEYVEHHAGIVLTNSSRRRLAETGAAMASYAATGASPEELADFAQRQIEETMERAKKTKGRPALGQIVRAVFQHIEMMLNDDSHRGISSGFIQFDSMTGNLRPSQFIVVGARPGVGKTSWLLNVALSVASAGHPVGFFSLEMAGDELVRRMLSMKSGLDHMRLLNAKLHENEWPTLVQAASKLTPMPITIEDSPMTLPALRSRIKFMVKEQQVKLICVDYLQLVKNKQRDGGREREVAEVSTTLKELAKEYRVPLIALAQLNRSMENRSVRRPQLSDLRESGSIEQDADFVGFLHRDPAAEVPADREKAEFIAAKNRHGPTGVIPMRFLQHITSYEEDDGVPV